MKYKYEYKYARLCWPEGGFAIVKDCQVCGMTFETPSNNIKRYSVDAIFIFGSRRGYVTSGKKFRFVNVSKIEELDKDFVAKNFFPGLL